MIFQFPYCIFLYYCWCISLLQFANEDWCISCNGWALLSPCSIFSILETKLVQYCNCIVTRGGVYNEILPEPEGFPEGSGNISSYTPTRVTIQSFSITSTSQFSQKLCQKPPETVIYQSAWRGPVDSQLVPLAVYKYGSSSPELQLLPSFSALNSSLS